MVELSRRRFLIASAGVGATGLLSGAVAIGWPDLLRAAQDRPLQPGTGILVIVSLYGGNDGINTVVPYSDPAYHDARPELAYAPEQVLHLDGQLGLNPGLKGLAGVWNNKRLAIVRGVSYPKPDHSHFRSMDIWQTASPDEPVATGWIGRWLDATGDDPVRAVNIGAVLPPLAVGAKTTAATLAAGVDPAAPGLAATIVGLGADDPHDTPMMAAVSASYRAARTAGDVLDAGRTVGPAPKGNGGNDLAQQLAVVTACVKAAVPTRVYTVTLGGFDTHADERGTQQRLLSTLDSAVTPFLADMAGDRYGRNVVVLMYSEFGRRVHANASQGTDHGTAAPVFVAGSPVRGGFYGEQPSLTDLDDGDLKPTMDFRDIYHEVLAHTLATDPALVLGPGRGDVGFL